jgi:FMN-dependent NADH-azoreductase
MQTVLHIDSSPRGEPSVSRRFTRRFVNLWKMHHPSDRVIYRDLGRHPVPHINEAWISAAFTPPDARLTEQKNALNLSDMLIDELLTSDRYVFGIPMYNLNVPSTLKAYIDQVVRIHRTFTYVDGNYEGLVKSKKMLVITARGDHYSNSLSSLTDYFQEPYLRAIFKLIGITDITFLHIDNLASGREARAHAISSAKLKVRDLAERW